MRKGNKKKIINTLKSIESKLNNIDYEEKYLNLLRLFFENKRN